MTRKDLKEARLKAGWTQKQAAQKLGLSQAYLSMAESGVRAISDELAD
jgi:transcriptional regulator with XRE-family HTH domain